MLRRPCCHVRVRHAHALRPAAQISSYERCTRNTSSPRMSLGVHTQRRYLSHFTTMFLTGVVGLPVALYSMKAILAVIFQNKLIYQGFFHRNSHGDPNKLGFARVEHISLPVDKVTLKGYYFSRQETGTPSNALMLYFQGNGGNLAMRLPHIRQVSEAAGMCDVLAVSYRGYGDSSGSASEKGIQRDADAIFDLACSKYNARSRPLLIYGHSLGGGVAIHLASQPKANELVSGIVLENTFTRIKDVVHAIYPKYTVYPHMTPFLWNHWLSIDRIPSIRAPILFLSGEKDDFIPPTQMKKLQASAKSSRFTEFVSFRGGRHNNLSHLPRYSSSIRDFIERCVPGKVEQGAYDSVKPTTTLSS